MQVSIQRLGGVQCSKVGVCLRTFSTASAICNVVQLRSWWKRLSGSERSNCRCLLLFLARFQPLNCWSKATANRLTVLRDWIKIYQIVLWRSGFHILRPSSLAGCRLQGRRWVSESWWLSITILSRDDHERDDKLIVNTEGALRRLMTYDYNDHPNLSRIYSSTMPGKLQKGSRRTRKTSNN